ncbi:HIT domain-containing protein [Paenibacillus sp. KQZ6P-2]|uniref:HIT domain-containing protein n=1 Tax=Paenibacillus mangrovi TaxID=2931978 RepID=A0A9X1WNF8_9BACL|nr:HIT domain-containing protein [Paenibacillus mangrovi]MCJ8010798.1 HIT domain-containing protein [Paenibacillus mangrovi]
MMTHDFYCDEVLNGHTQVKKVMETENVLAYHHTRPSYEHHIVVIPKIHVQSLISDEKENDESLLLELMKVIKKIAAEMTATTGAAKIITNLGEYQDSKHFHWHVVSGKKIR